MRVLITGKTGYVAVRTAEYLKKKNIDVDMISVRDNSWKSINFSEYDAVIHTAAIVHRKAATKHEYYETNIKLTKELAQKAKDEGVGTFIFMSSVAVYGLEGKVGEDVVISENTECLPKTLYGKSKLAAEKKLDKLSSSNFRIAIIRAPIIYGEGAPGNYDKLAKLVKLIRFFPKVENRRSMLHIDALAEFLLVLLNNKCAGVFLPQDSFYMTTERLIGCMTDKKIYFSKVLGCFVRKAAAFNISFLNKLFGNLIIER